MKNHVLVIPPLIQTAKKDSWISVLLAMLIAFVCIWMIVSIHKKTKKENLLKWLNEHVNKGVVAFLVGLLLLIFTIMSVVTLRETVTWINISLLPKTPEFVTAIILGLVCLLTACTNLKSICIINQFLLFFVVILGFFVATVNMQHKDFSLLLPVFEHGYRPILKGILYPLSGFIELIFILFIQDQIKEKLRFRYLAVTLFILTGLTIGPLVGAIIEFSQGEAERLRFPAYEEWELVAIGHFIEHIFFFVIYQWLTGAFIRITLMFFFIRELLSLINKKVNQLFFAIFIVVIVLTLYPMNDFQYSFILFYVLIPFTAIFFIGFTIILYGFVTFAARHEKGMKNEA